MSGNLRRAWERFARRATQWTGRPWAFGIALGISDDLRLLYVSGALLFAVAAFFLSTTAQEDLITAVLLLLAGVHPDEGNQLDQLLQGADGRGADR